MLRILLIATCLLSAQASRNRIIGGDYSNIYEVPYTAALLLDKEAIGSFLPTCTGIVIGIRTVLTAAQCTNGTIGSQWLARAGTPFLNSEGQLNFGSHLFQHSDFNNKYDNDIAMIILLQDFRLGDALAIAALPKDGEIVPGGAIGISSGFGPIFEETVFVYHMHSVKVPIISQEDCVAAYSEYNPVTDNMICAGDLENGGKGPCKEDLGGPLVVNNVLVGITSWSLGCARPKYPGVWTRVSKYRAWIDERLI